FAPFLFYILYFIPKRIFLVTISIILSIFCQIVFGTSPEAFQLMICRLWQFLIGSLAFYKSKDKNSLVFPVAEEGNEEQTQISMKDEKLFFKKEFLALSFILFICFYSVQ